MAETHHDSEGNNFQPIIKYPAKISMEEKGKKKKFADIEDLGKKKKPISHAPYSQEGH